MNLGRTHVLTRGFTLVELIISVAIMAVLSGLLLSSFNTSAKRQAVDKGADTLVALVNEARSLTISSKAASSYGVWFASTTATLFTGTSFSGSSAQNRTMSLDSRLAITNISLNAATSSIVFDKLTGSTSHYGSFRLTLTTDPTIYKTISVYKTGVAEVQ